MYRKQGDCIGYENVAVVDDKNPVGGLYISAWNEEMFFPCPTLKNVWGTIKKMDIFASQVHMLALQLQELVLQLETKVSYFISPASILL